MTLYTEKEAAEKWCPLDHTPKSSLANIAYRCIGSRCMAWRQEMEAFTPPGGDPLSNFKPKRPTGRGYCGAFGKVEP